jgi:hypothetical protein
LLGDVTLAKQPSNPATYLCSIFNFSGERDPIFT